MTNTNYRAGGYDIGKKHDASLITPGAATPQDDIVRDNVVVADSVDPLAVAAVKNTAPTGTEYGLLVRTVGGGGGGGPATIADGADVAEGSTTDAAVTGDNPGTVSAKLRGISKILFNVWDSVNSWLKVSIQNATLAVTQSGVWSVGRTWTLGSAGDSVTTVPSGTQTVSGTVTANQGTLAAASTRNDTYTGPASGVSVNVASGVKSFAIQVKSTGAVATSWDLRLEGSLDGVNWSTILQHTNVTGDGAVVWSGSALAPSLFYRSRAAGLVLGAATNI